MNDNFYKQLIETSPTGYAYQKIICDKDGIPCDYEFIEVNATFRKLLGLRVLDIVGRRFTEVFPINKNRKFDWIKFCGDIAINGGEKEVEQYIESFQGFYKVYIHSHEKYFFMMSFIDINKQMKQLSEMERLNEISKEFLQINEQKIDYQRISDNFLKICGAKYAAFNLFEEDGKAFTTIAISGDKGMIKKISRVLGSKLEGKKWGIDPILSKTIRDKTITRIKSFRTLVEDVIPVALVVLLEKAFSMGEVILITILKNDIMLGHFTLVMQKGKSFDKDTLAQLYTRQLGMVIMRKRVEDELSHEKILTDAIFNSAPGMIYLYDNQNRLVRWNKKHEDITGYTSRELSKMSIKDWYNGDEKSMLVIKENLSKVVKEGFSDCEAELRIKDGTKIPMYFTASSLHLDGKQYFAGIAIDITELKKKEKEILYLSYHDHLTGLYNRRFYEEELKRIDTDKNLPITIVMGDVNGLKLTNDSFGHNMGDELIKKVAKLITKGCRADDIIARLGGDEFIIILPKTSSFEADNIIKQITSLSLSEKVGSIDISISFGYETKNNVEEKIEEIFKSAEDNMYKKKLLERQLSSS